MKKILCSVVSGLMIATLLTGCGSQKTKDDMSSVRSDVMSDINSTVSGTVSDITDMGDMDGNFSSNVGDNENGKVSSTID